MLRTILAILMAGIGAARAEPKQDFSALEKLYPSLDALYQELHRAPELSGREEKTAAKMATRLRAAGFTVTEHVGGHGLVGVLKNGNGPTVMVRTELDALPIKEETGLPYASTATAKNAAGDTVGVMHACGHDIHMTSWVGAATLLGGAKERWRGTLVFVAQPSEEVVVGAEAMVKDGLFTRFPKPDFLIAIHDDQRLASGQVGMTPGPAFAASNAVDLTFYGQGGHGAAPHLTIDPIVMAARSVVTLQTIVSREVNPLDPAVVTVGTFHAGSKRNIIANDAKLELTVRSYKPEVQKQLLAAIERIAKAEAAAARASREPVMAVVENSEVVSNDTVLMERISSALRRGLGEENVVSLPPVMGAEDFGVLGRVAGAPSVELRVGSSEPGELARAKAEGKLPPGLHTSKFAPDRQRTIRTGVKVFMVSVLELLGGTGA
jgi:hippurate hydrolase